MAVFAIARRDISGYLSAPKAAVLFMFFLGLTGLFFHNFVHSFVEMHQRAPMQGGEAPGLDVLLKALFQNLQFIILLTVPAVSMGSFSEEKKNQSFRILQTAPISTLEIVLGKFLSLAGIMSIVVLASAVYPMYTMVYGNPDVGPILTSYLGVILLMCSQLAFGMWVSSLTSNQILAALFTLFGLFLLLILSWAAPDLGGGSAGEAFIKYLASTTHYENFLKGMITVADVTYFVLFTATFLFFTHIVVDSQRWR